MRYWSVLAAALAVAIGFAPGISAQSPHQAPVALSPHTTGQLADGGRSRVIVHFVHDPVEHDRPGSVDADAHLVSIIEGERDAVFRRVFASTTERMEAESDGTARLHRAFDFTPAAAMYLTQAEIAALAADPGVARIETDAMEYASLDQSVPAVGADLVQAAGVTGTGTTIAVLDTGIHYAHPAFNGRIAASACFASNVLADSARTSCNAGATRDTTSAQAATVCFDDNATVLDCHHGTHVAAIAAGASGNSGGVNYTLTGVAPGARIIPVQVFSEIYLVPNSICDTGPRCAVSYVSDQLAALEWLYANRVSLGVNVINMSLGGAPQSGACDGDARAAVIGNLRAAGILTVAAAGNDGQTGQMSAPACITNTVSVAALNSLNRNASFSNVSTLTDFFAPGQDIESAWGPVPGNPVNTASGTSMAAPHVAGAIALARSAFPSASSDDIQWALSLSGTPIAYRASAGPIPAVRIDRALSRLARSGDPAGALTLTPRGVTTINLSSATPSQRYAEFVLTNSGSSAQSWSAFTDVDWLTISRTAPTATAQPAYFTGPSGTLAPGESVSLFAAPQSPGTGVFTAQLIIRTPSGPLAREIEVQSGARRPPNDNFADAFPIIAGAPTRSVSLAYATLEVGEAHATSATNSVWFYFDPPETRIYRLTTYGTESRAYTGGPDALDSRVISGTSSPIGPINRFDFLARRGERVYFALLHRTELSTTIAVSTADNNIQSGNAPFVPYPLMTGSGRYEHAVEATDTPWPGEPDLGQNNSFVQWFRWTAPFTGSYELSDAQNGTGRITSFTVFRRTDGADTHNQGDDWSLLESVAQLSMSEDTPEGGNDAEQRRLAFTVQSGTTYWFRLGRQSSSGNWRFAYARPYSPDHALRAAVLPNERRVRLGGTATAFMTLVNPARFGAAATGCRVELDNPGTYGFEYRLTDGGNNATSPNNPRFDIASGASQSLVFSVRPGNTGFTEPDFRYLCDNVLPAEQASAADSFRVNAGNDEAPDIVAIAVTPTGDGIINIPSSGTRAYAVAAVNIGARLEFVTMASLFSHGASLQTEFCETDPATGACLTARTNGLAVPFETGQVRTFTIFVTSDNRDPQFDPSAFRHGVFFSTNGGERFGSTSVAIRISE